MKGLACGYVKEEHHGQREKQVQRPCGKSLIGKLNIQKEAIEALVDIEEVRKRCGDFQDILNTLSFVLNDIAGTW